MNVVHPLSNSVNKHHEHSAHKQRTLTIDAMKPLPSINNINVCIISIKFSTAV